MGNKLRRANVNDTVKMTLLCEVRGSCPLCNRNLIAKRNSKNVRVFDVAHIYPLNATEYEKKILRGEELLTNVIDSEENFIVLCKECHKIYDTQKTVEEYRQLVAINKIRLLSQAWDKQTLHKDIAMVANDIDFLSDRAVGWGEGRTPT